jgi:hypothetical protein
MIPVQGKHLANPRAGESINVRHSTAFDKIDFSVSSSRLTVTG